MAFAHPGISLLSGDLIHLVSKFLAAYYRRRWWKFTRRHYEVFRRVANHAILTSDTNLTMLPNLNSLYVARSELADIEGILSGVRTLELRDITIQHKMKLPQLRTLTLIRCNVRCDWLNSPNLTTLNCKEVENLFAYPNVLLRMLQLQRLHVEFGGDHGPYSILHLSSLNHLTSLAYIGGKLTRTTWHPRLSSTLLELTTNQWLDLSGCINLTALSYDMHNNLAVGHMTKLTYLRDLCSHQRYHSLPPGSTNLPLRRLHYIGQSDLSGFTTLETLSAMALFHEDYTLTNLASLRVVVFSTVINRLHNLTDLCVDNNDGQEDLSTLTQLRKLRLRLNIPGYPISLRRLYVNSWQDKNSLNQQSLVPLTNLHELTVYTRVPEYLPSVFALTQLTRLVIRYNDKKYRAKGACDAYVRNLQCLTNLTYLNVILPFQDVQWLTSLRMLEALTVNNRNMLQGLPDWLQGVAF